MTGTLGSWKLQFAVVLLSAVGTSQLATANTLCVNPGGTGGCHKTITSALAAAAALDTIKVGAGTYKEDVVIRKPIFLVGAGSNFTIVDATGKSNAFYVDGLDHPNLYSVSIQGFTAKNANFEGIAVTNTTNVTISDNHVTNNDLSLDVKTSTCPGLPTWETAEGFDCGEGMHLSGVRYSTISNNISDGNSGGILISDDTGITEFNLISGNTFKDNVYDCGITTASHPPYTGTKPYGVVNNTISGNTSTGNGTAVSGAGAGILLAVAVVGGTNEANVLINNVLTHNGLPGVTIHSHAAGENLQRNIITGNTIAYNGADTADAATPGPTGINVFGVSGEYGTVIAQNTISNESYDIVANTPAPVIVHLNNLYGNGKVGVDNIGSGSVDATQNYWGCPSGPSIGVCSTVSGPQVAFYPFLTKKY
jgi:hypothetical protein